VVLGASGSVITDAFGPYEVFARSQEFFAYTVSAGRPTAMLSGGLAVMPDYSLAEVEGGVAPEPDVVVVPAVAAPNGPTEIGAQRWAPGDLAYLLAVVFPWLRPTVGVGLVEGVGELEVAALVEVYASSFAAGTVPIAGGATVTTRHGLRLVATPANAGALRIDRLVVAGIGRIEEVDAQLLGWAAARGLKVELANGGQAAGQFCFDVMLADLAGHSDQTTARVTAKSVEYPTEQLEVAGAGWPWPPTALLALTVTVAIGIGLVPAAATRRRRR
jgi:hypothetical protein